MAGAAASPAVVADSGAVRPAAEAGGAIAAGRAVEEAGWARLAAGEMG